MTDKFGQTLCLPHSPPTIHLPILQPFKSPFKNHNDNPESNHLHYRAMCDRNVKIAEGLKANTLVISQVIRQHTKKYQHTHNGTPNFGACCPLNARINSHMCVLGCGHCPRRAHTHTGGRNDWKIGTYGLVCNTGQKSVSFPISQNPSEVFARNHAPN